MRLISYLKGLIILIEIIFACDMENMRRIM